MIVAHLTSVHSRYDVRIFLKQCSSLAVHGYKVFLVVGDGLGNEIRNGVQVIDAGASNGRFDRIRNAPRRVLEKAVDIKADIYHLHDPELIPIGLKLKSLGRKVVFDAHEDVPKQLLSKPYLNRLNSWLLSKAFSIYERWACTKLDAVVSATPHIRNKYLAMGVRSVDINNFPLLDEFAVEELDWARKERQICYVGGISQVRGILELVEAMRFTSSGATLQLAGSFEEAKTEQLAKENFGWQRVNENGFLSRRKVAEILAKSVAGIVTFLPAPNHIDAQPNKMFEYMSAGVPVIASNFPLWAEIIQGNNCGLCVDPLDPKAIAEAIDYLVNHPEVAEQMGRNGQKAINQNYNWTFEQAKLVNLYSSL